MLDSVPSHHDRLSAEQPSDVGIRLLEKTGVFSSLPKAEAVAELRRHPQLPAAMRASARFLVELYEGNRLVNLVSNDRGRFIVAVLAMYLHFTRRPDDPASGLTATRLKEICAETGLCSSGRASAIIALMRWGGYLAPDEESLDRRVKLLRPTEKLVSMHRARWRRQLEAAAIVMPEMQQALDRFDDPDFVANYAVAYAGNFIGGLRLYHYAPGVMFFTHFNAGLLILYEILLAGDAHDAMPPRETLSASASALAKRFHVSRPHVTNVLRKAQAEGLLTVSGKQDIQVHILPRLAEDILNYFPALFLMNAAAAHYALARPEVGSTA